MLVEIEGGWVAQGARVAVQGNTPEEARNRLEEALRQGDVIDGRPPPADMTEFARTLD